MIYKQGIIAEAYNKEGTKRIVLNKFNQGYRVSLYAKKINVFSILKQKKTKYKKYAERRFIEFLQEM